MAETTEIAWADSTFNPWIGCTRVSPGCDHCYAARQDGFRKWTPEGWGGPRKRTKTWGDPVKWNAEHETFFAQRGRRRRVFCASLADVFDNQVPTSWRIELFNLIARTPNLDWLLLTKRIGNAGDMLEVVLNFGTVNPGCAWPWPNVWLGSTVVNQEEADRDIPKLLQVPARVRFLSIEPMLGHVDLSRWLRCPSRGGGNAAGKLRCGLPVGHEGDHSALIETGAPWLGGGELGWVIAGGESGPGARPAHPDWFRSLKQQCQAAGVPFFMKQMTKKAEIPADLMVREFPHAA